MSNTKLKVVHFGAGNIGRGFIGKVLADAGAEVVFADVVPELIGLLHERRQYGVTIAGPETRTETVTGVDGVLSTGDEVIDRIAEADLVTTAVGPTILPRIAPVIAAGLERRVAKGGRGAMNVIACENMVRGTTHLKSYVFDRLTEGAKAAVEETVGFADSAVDRIVPPQKAPAEAPLDVTVEEFSEWIVDRTQLRGAALEIEGLTLTGNLISFIERKLFTLNTGHAVAAYLGSLEGCATIQETMTRPELVDTVRATMQESGAVLIARHGFEPAAHAAYIEKILKRFANPALRDEVARVAREPIRKLGRNERFISPLMGALEFGLPREHLVRSIAAVLLYVDETDSQASELQARIEKEGVIATFNDISGHAVPMATVQQIDAAVRAMRSERRGSARQLKVV
jgi:mannitol-1-phosphate 5-dehydrogenase